MSAKYKSRGASNQQVGRAGEYFVVAELNKRGAFAVPFAGNMPKIDIIACNSDESRTVYIQVKTKRGGKTWHSSIVGSQPMSPKADENNSWFGGGGTPMGRRRRIKASLGPGGAQVVGQSPRCGLSGAMVYW
jgi:hypothetical protein